MVFIEKIIEAGQDFQVIGVDPGPEQTAMALVRMHRREADGRYRAALCYATYFNNDKLDGVVNSLHVRTVPNIVVPLFLCVETCGAQFKAVGASVFDTAAMGGCVRYAMRNQVDGIYCMRSSEWRCALTGHGNAKTPLVYEEVKQFFDPAGKGSDPYKGVNGAPGPLWDLHEAGKGGNVEHLKDALGAALGLQLHKRRTSESPERFRKAW